jgi:hypothetical protein
LRTLLSVVFGVFGVAAPVAFAQSATSLAETLSGDAPCAAQDARTALKINVGKSGAAAADIAVALRAIAIDTDVCAQVRDAAGELMAAMALPPERRAAAVPSRAIADTQAEAERRAASMKFEVGPPPPRLTGGGFPGL